MAKKYSTTFAADEDPLSESSAWQTRINTLLTDMKSVAATGRANAKALGIAAYDDSAALLTGYAADAEITATVFKATDINTGAGHECEILHRAAQTTTISTQYECLFSFNGNIQCFRWFSNGGTQDFEGQTALLGSESKGGEFVTGDRIRARVCGSIIIMSYLTSGGTETLLGVYNNTVLTSGQPGIGGFIRSLDGADATKWCFSDSQISDIFTTSQKATDDCARSNETPLTKSGAWASGSDMNALDLVSNRILNHTGDSDSGMRYTGVTAWPDHYSEITIGTVGGGDFGAAVCMMPNGDCFLTTNFNATNLFIYQRISGVFDALNNPPVAGVYANGDVIGLRRFGSYLMIYQNGTLKDTVSAITSLVGGTHGVFGFDATYRISAWAGGNVVATYDAVPGSGGTVNTSTLTSTLLATEGFISSVSRGRNNADTLTIADANLNGSIRGVTTSEALTIGDNTFFQYLLTRVSEDGFALTDELRAALILRRIQEDGFVLTDGTIASLTASQIITFIASSLIVFTDENFLFLLRTLSAADLLTIADSALVTAERGAYTSDAFLTSDEGRSQLSLTRQLASAFDFADMQFSFQLLTRQLQSLFSSSDSSISDISHNTPATIDGSKISTGFQRPSIVLGSHNLVRIA